MDLILIGFRTYLTTFFALYDFYSSHFSICVRRSSVGDVIFNAPQKMFVLVFKPLQIFGEIKNIYIYGSLKLVI